MEELWQNLINKGRKKDIFSPQSAQYLLRKKKYNFGKGGGKNMIFWENVYPSGPVEWKKSI